MAKYTDDQLRAYAIHFIEARKNGDARCKMVVMMLCIMFQGSAEECIKRIEELAIA